MKKYLIISFFSLLASLASATSVQEIHHSFFSQNLYLHRAEDLITQNIYKAELTWQDREIGQTYFGAYLDYDTKSDDKVTFTDKQFTPLVGHQTNYLFGYPARFFAELRFLHRDGAFADQRPQHTTEVRSGLITYRFDEFSFHQFLENYAILYYTSLNSGDVAFQGWLKHGVRFKNIWHETALDILHEINADLSRSVQPDYTYFDYLPGLRYGYFGSTLQIYLLQSYAIELQKKNDGRDFEWRSLFVVGAYF